MDLLLEEDLDRVLLMTFSEFGRTVKENGRRGTGHGAAAPVFLVGRKVKGGTIDFLFEHANPVPRALEQVYDENNDLVWGKALSKKLKHTFMRSRVMTFEVFNDWTPVDDCFVSLDPDEREIVDGTKTMEEMGQAIFQLFLDTASGKKTKSELLGLGDNEFVPWQVGAVM